MAVTDIEDLVGGLGPLNGGKSPPGSHHPSGKTIDQWSPEKHQSSVQTTILSLATKFTEFRKFFGDSFVPGTRTIYVKTWGCSHNRSDSEYMGGLLTQAGYQVTYDRSNSSDLWLLNSCTVKTPSEAQLHSSIKGAIDGGIPVVVAGCVSQAAPKTPWLKGLSLIGVQQIDRIVEVVEETLKGNSVRLLATKREGGKRLGGASLALPKIRKNPLIEILAINTGCLNHCTYCKTKQARGDLASYPIEELVDRAKQSFEEGVKEIWLTSEDLGAYGRDLGVTLPDLLLELVEVIPEDCMMRLGMTNPPYIMDHLEEIAIILNHPRVYGFIHIPVQAGSDAVLSDMLREYTCGDFRKVANFLTEKVAGVSIATDVICGFPTETAEDFEETLQLVRDYKFPSIFINQYFPRPGTPAARLKRVDTAEVKRRTKALSQLFRSYNPYDGREGKVYRVLVTEKASDGEKYVGHTKSYEQILLPSERNLLGHWVTARVVSVGKFSMIGEILSDFDSSEENLVASSDAKVISQHYAAGKGWVLRSKEFNKWFWALVPVLLLILLWRWWSFLI